MSKINLFEQNQYEINNIKRVNVGFYTCCTCTCKCGDQQDGVASVAEKKTPDHNNNSVSVVKILI